MGVRNISDALETVIGSPTDKLVLIVIANHADDDTKEAWPSIPTLARKTDLSERAVWGAIQRLKAAGRLVLMKSGRRRSNTYRLVLPSHEVRGRTRCEVAPGASQARTTCEVTPAPGASDPSLNQKRTVSAPARAFKARAPRDRGFVPIGSIVQPCRWGHHPPCLSHSACTERERRLIEERDRAAAS